MKAGATGWKATLGALSLAAATALALVGTVTSPAGAGTWSTHAQATGRHKHAGASSQRKRAGATPVVHVAKVTGAGKVLVDSGGETVYVFSPDKHGKSTCSGACAAAWPPVLTSHKPTAGSGARKSLLGTVRRHGGKLQVTYHHWPLYTFAGDSGPGQDKGNGLQSFGGKWSTIAATGKAFGSTAGRRSTSTTTTGGYGSGGSGGYGY